MSSPVQRSTTMLEKNTMRAANSVIVHAFGNELASYKYDKAPGSPRRANGWPLLSSMVNSTIPPAADAQTADPTCSTFNSKRFPRMSELRPRASRKNNSVRSAPSVIMAAASETLCPTAVNTPTSSPGKLLLNLSYGSAPAETVARTAGTSTSNAQSKATAQTSILLRGRTGVSSGVTTSGCAVRVGVNWLRFPSRPVQIRPLKRRFQSRSVRQAR